MKLTNIQKEELRQFTKNGTIFIRKISFWKTGGRFDKTPPFVIRLNRCDTLPDDAKVFFEENENLKRALYIPRADREFVKNSIADL